jgi:hypothetical protein
MQMVPFLMSLINDVDIALYSKSMLAAPLVMMGKHATLANEYSEEHDRFVKMMAKYMQTNAITIDPFKIRDSRLRKELLQIATPSDNGEDENMTEENNVDYKNALEIMALNKMKLK